MQRRVQADAEAAKNVLFKKHCVVAGKYEGLRIAMSEEGKNLPSLDYLPSRHVVKTPSMRRKHS